MLTHAIAAREASYHEVQQKIRAQGDLVQLLESQLHAARSANEMQVQQLEAQLQREQLERSMAEGALEAGRKDVARLLRELGAVQYRPLPAAAGAEADRLRSAA
jgi:predicted patatin/cPLA2 family phospholipase